MNDKISSSKKVQLESTVWTIFFSICVMVELYMLNMKNSQRRRRTVKGFIVHHPNLQIFDIGKY